MACAVVCPAGTPSRKEEGQGRVVLLMRHRESGSHGHRDRENGDKPWDQRPTRRFIRGLQRLGSQPGPATSTLVLGASPSSPTGRRALHRQPYQSVVRPCLVCQVPDRSRSGRRRRRVHAQILPRGIHMTALRRPDGPVLSSPSPSAPGRLTGPPGNPNEPGSGDAALPAPWAIFSQSLPCPRFPSLRILSPASATPSTAPMYQRSHRTNGREAGLASGTRLLAGVAVARELRDLAARYPSWWTSTTSASRSAVPNGFAKDWLETRYRSLISQTLARIVGYSVQVEFVVGGIAGRRHPAPLMAPIPTR